MECITIHKCITIYDCFKLEFFIFFFICRVSICFFRVIDGDTIRIRWVELFIEANEFWECMTIINKIKILTTKKLSLIHSDILNHRHYPLYPFLESNSYSGPLSQNSISIRVYGVDAPELGKKAFKLEWTNIWLSQ